jgi:hypothetical protein
MNKKLPVEMLACGCGLALCLEWLIFAFITLIKTFNLYAKHKEIFN